MSKAKILEVARKTRAWAMRARVRMDFSEDLCGMCAIAAARLHKNLSDNGIMAKIGVRNKTDDAHCFVIAYGFIIDITATQFCMKPVEVVPMKKARKSSFWRHTRIVKDASELLMLQKKSKWPIEQQARI